MGLGDYKYEISEKLKERDGSLLNHFLLVSISPLQKPLSVEVIWMNTPSENTFRNLSAIGSCVR